MGLSRSAIRSGAWSMNSGITSTARTETTIAVTIARYTAKRAMRCAGVKRRQVFASSVAVVTRSASLFVHPAALEEYRAYARSEQLADEDQEDDGQQHRAHEIVVEALERGEQRAADAARADDAHHRRVAQVGIELIGRKADEAPEHLRQHAVRDHVHERRAGRPHGLDLL